MDERYSKLFSLPENLYTIGAPVIISAGALLKDNQTGKVLAQLKLQNICSKIIKALKLKVSALDVVGNKTGEEKEQKYLDLSAKRNDMFGQKLPIYFDDNSTRGFEVTISEIIFDDNSTWTANGTEKWESLHKQQTLMAHFNDIDILQQYKINSACVGENLPSVEKDIWRCTCGAVNRRNETTCCNCGGNIRKLFGALDMDSLKTTCEERLEKEKEEEAEAKREAEKRSKALKKKLRIIAPIAIVFIIICVIISNNIKKSNVYKNAVSLIENQKYDLAIETFDSLGNYKNSVQMITCCKIMKTAEKSLLEASKMDIPDIPIMDNLKKAIETYLPYCGKFKCTDEKDEVYKNKSFISDFEYYNTGDIVCWAVKDDYKILQIEIYNNKIVFFDDHLECKVNEMTVSDQHIYYLSSSYNILFNATITFDKNILFEISYKTNYSEESDTFKTYFVKID